MTTDELDLLLLKNIVELRAGIDAFDENRSMREESQDDGKTTDIRAIEALKRPERFAGEHEVAKAWLFNSPTASIWSRNGHK